MSAQEHAISVGIVGASGYSGIELAKILSAHPNVDLAAVYGDTSAGQALAEAAPALRGLADLEVLPSDPGTICRAGHDAVFLCTPHEASAALAPTLLDAGLVVLDLSAGFRLNRAAEYDSTYGFRHPASHLLDSAVYALPELHRGAIASSNLLACPGCYPTSAILPIAPLLEHGIIDTTGPIIVDATSGVSGAGRRANERTSFCEVSQRPYGVLTHRHTPEIAQALPGASVVFTAHLGPYNRGIQTTIHAALAAGCTGHSAAEVLKIAYEHEPFVRLRSTGDWPGVSDVAYSNFIDIAVASDEPGGRLIVFSAIDNLLKGASGQAVQAFNIRFGFDETTGLPCARGPRRVVLS